MLVRALRAILIAAAAAAVVSYLPDAARYLRIRET